MVVSGRRVRRLQREHSILPTRTTTQTHLSHTLSCWYCDFKISALNDLFYLFGRKHARCLRIWFSVGVGFSFTALLVVTLVLVWELVISLYLYNGNVEFKNGSDPFLFRFLPLPLVPSFRMAVADGGYIILSTLVSVAVHEFGHAVAAARSCFLVMFPGALVALDYDTLQSLPRFSTLRIYSAGVWHNAALKYFIIWIRIAIKACNGTCLCGGVIPSSFDIISSIHVWTDPNGTLHLLLVLDVSAKSPLSGYLSTGDVIVSLDGKEVHDPQEWKDMIALINKQALQSSYNFNNSVNFQAVHGQKGYCIPNSWVEDNMKKMQREKTQSACPDELTMFSSIPCFNSSLISYGSSEDNHWKRNQRFHCFSARDVVQLKKCGSRWPATDTLGNSCVCSQDEACLVPVPMPGLNWVEITYARPYSPECLSSWRNSSTDVRNLDSEAANCSETFVFIGDVFSLENAVLLTAYQPRWGLMFGAHIPNMLGKFLACTFHVSLTLTLMNSLPVRSQLQLLSSTPRECMGSRIVTNGDNIFPGVLFGWRVYSRGAFMLYNLAEPKEEEAISTNLPYGRDSFITYYLFKYLIHYLL
ncbi:hypothetical protein GIB67_035293 [Kingdonia uniflora]|uniref:Endopeptidase S2P n=1 Tax=Kingdonia uniflora TaxID=39325 RepID=A0A7J7KY37_9MAGN|nr:hypothetical protein GIB67_035293 [Kingdonia uniflora]